MKSSKYIRIGYLIFLLLFLSLGLVGFLYFKNSFTKVELPLSNESDEINENNETLEQSGIIKVDEVKKNNVDQQVVGSYNNYLVEGLKYKASGDAGNKDDYYQAINSFQKAVDLTNGQYWVPVVNIANIYKTLGEYGKSEVYYNNALKISNYSESSIYISKIDLYKNYLKKDNNSIISLYDEAVDNVVIDQMVVIADYASFLKSISKYRESLDYYRILSKSYPNNSRYRDEVVLLESLVK
ncbi:MAG: hypothetical protein WC441_01350 [Patescibacteria group bacterium]